MNDPDLEDLGNALHAAAARFAIRCRGRPPDAHALCRRAAARTRQQRTLAVAAALLLLGAGALSAWRLRGPVILDEPPRVPARLLAQQPIEPVAAPVAQAAGPAPHPLPPAEIAHALPVIFTVPDGKGGHKAIATGYYVPERVTPVRLENLSAAEQLAVRRMLGEQSHVVSQPGI